MSVHEGEGEEVNAFIAANLFQLDISSKIYRMPDGGTDNVSLY